MARRDSKRPTPGEFEISTGTVELRQESSDQDLYTVFVNGVPSSSVHLADPKFLDFEYLRWMADLIDLWGAPPSPVQAVHLGGAGCALPRYVDAARPGSKQVVVELDPILAEHARVWFNLPRSPALRIQIGDARERLTTRANDSAQLVVRDVFAGEVTPPHLITTEMTTEVRRVLQPGGVYLVNIADRPPMTMLRRELATLGSVFQHLALVADPSLLRGRRYANAVVAASDIAIPVADWSRRVAGGPAMGRLVAGADLEKLIAGAKPLFDPPVAES